MEQILATSCLEGIDYCESSKLTELGGFLIVVGEQRRITIKAHLPEEEKTRGVEYLLAMYHADVPNKKGAMYLWTEAPEA